MRITVVGAGIAGSLVTRMLRKRGHVVTLIDDKDPHSGSGASSNLYVASWLKKFPSSSAKLGIEVLEHLIPKEHIGNPFSRGIADAFRVRHVASEHLLVQPDEVGTAGDLSDGSCVAGAMLRGKPTIWCCGHRDPWVKIEVLVGHCVLLEGTLEPGQSSLTMPLPYRHHKLYQHSPGVIYFANSTALKLESFRKRKDELYSKLVAQAWCAVGRQCKVLEHRVGYRPCIPGHEFGKLTTVAPGVWSVNGGGKNGMIAYAALAHRLAEEVGAP